MSNIQFLIFSSALLLLTSGFILDSRMEQDQKSERKSYCELVSMWEEDAESGIEPANRNGMPNYKEIDCEL